MAREYKSSQDWVKVWIASSDDSFPLAGLLLHPADANPWAVLVVCHGFTGSKEGGGRTLDMGRFLADRTGVAVLVFDFAGHGESRGAFEDLTLSRQIRDLGAVVDWCGSELGLPVLSTGRSFGGTTVVCRAAADERIRAVCTWAAPGRPYELFHGMAADQDGRWVTFSSSEATVRLRRAFLEDLKQYDVLAAAGALAPRPLMVVHGDQDNDVLPREAELIHASAGEPKAIRIIPDADHRFQVNAGLAWEATREWIECVMQAQVAFLLDKPGENHY
mgnify:CR=1 FL=1